MTQERISTNHLRLTCDEAAELCIHHLRLAALFFESGPDDINLIVEEARRQMLSKNSLDNDEHVFNASREFLIMLDAAYAEMKMDD